MATNPGAGYGYDTTTTYNSSVTSTQVPPSSGTEAPSVDDLIGDEEQDADEDEEGAITGVTRPPKRIVLTKRTSYLAIFILVTLLSLGATIYIAIIFLDEYDYPPTEYSYHSLRDSILSLIALTIVTPIGFVILKFRITNLLVGMMYLFLLVLCLIFPTKAIAEAIYSITYDQENNIHQHAKNPLIEHKLHNFWAAFQVQESCCGTKEIDRVEDWPYFLNSSDLPASCCTAKQKNYAKSLGLLLKSKSDFTAGLGNSHKAELDPTSSYCGRGLARTRTKGLTSNKTLMFKRVFSGFFLSLTTNQIQKMYAKYTLPAFNFNPQNYFVDILDAVHGKVMSLDGVTAFKRIWKNFYVDNVCNTQDDLFKIRGMKPDPNVIPGKYCAVKHRDYDNDIAHPADLDHTSDIETLGVIKDYKKARETCEQEGYEVYKAEQMEKKVAVILTQAEYCDQQIPKYRSSATTFGRELLLQLDYLTTYIYELAQPKQGALPVTFKTWMLWPVPTRFDDLELYPYKLAANYLRYDNDPNKIKKMYYFSRGISENLVLENIIHSKTCESIDHLPSIKSKIARDLNKRWRRGKPFSEWKNKEEGLGNFFLSQVRKMTYISIGVSSSCIFCVLFLSFIFWQYYSRIKAEEYANLALPKEFEVLHLRRSLIDEADIVVQTPKNKRKSRFFKGRATRVGPGQLFGKTPPAHLLQRRPVRPLGMGPMHHHLAQGPGGMGRGQAPGGMVRGQAPGGMGRGQGLRMVRPQAPGPIPGVTPSAPHPGPSGVPPSGPHPNPGAQLQSF